jgi:hypothetical protein
MTVVACSFGALHRPAAACGVQPWLGRPEETVLTRPITVGLISIVLRHTDHVISSGCRSAMWRGGTSARWDRARLGCGHGSASVWGMP